MDIIDVFSKSENLISLLTLTLMEIVLGVDNIIFISIVTSRLPKREQPKARALGLFMALFIRILLLASISWLAGMTDSIFSVMGNHFSARDLILLAGGLFLVYKTTMEIFEKLEGEEEHLNQAKKKTFLSVVFQVVLIDIVFSFDSIITAIGLSREVIIMVTAVILSMMVMLAFSGYVSAFINRHPSMKILALAFLLLIGVMLIAEGFHQEFDRSYLYFAMAFSMGVEGLNIAMRKKSKPVKLKDTN